MEVPMEVPMEDLFGVPVEAEAAGGSGVEVEAEAAGGAAFFLPPDPGEDGGLYSIRWEQWMGYKWCVSMLIGVVQFWERDVYDEEQWFWGESLGTAVGSHLGHLGLPWHKPGVLQVGRRWKRTWVETWTQSWDLENMRWRMLTYSRLQPEDWIDMDQIGLRLKYGTIFVGGLGGNVWDRAGWVPERDHRSGRFGPGEINIHRRETRLGF